MKRNSKVSHAVFSLGFSLASLLGTTMIVNAIEAEYLLLNSYFRVDGNQLSSTVQPLQNSNVTQFCLQASSNVSWWKGLKILDSQGKQISLIVTENDSRLSCTPNIQNSRLAGGKIEFWKAKTFGAHTYMDSARIDVNQVKGKKITINWINE
ncbi:unknown [Crocosphaera subtropica ATCC 51142]|uniref:Uncharacterized protein n=1 Tax=Crocosphaera subtropica (strain ATCC 51142 / BH68) TaxID=43989 RepID=B1WRN5_CROS5|nr:hypothetical protein [Crocosphaera subtropica]ACB53476.1 unknown [Crocosphaera subtropica ATCC 51142]